VSATFFKSNAGVVVVVVVVAVSQEMKATFGRFKVNFVISAASH
jgi:hypothetical protein